MKDVDKQVLGAYAWHMSKIGKGCAAMNETPTSIMLIYKMLEIRDRLCKFL